MDLSKFCARATDPRGYLRQPFRDAGEVVATNGHLVIAVPDFEGEFPDAVERMAGRHRKMLESTPHTGEQFRIDQIALPELIPCYHCDGRGFYWVQTCPICNGSGEFKHGEHHYECKECLGNGRVGTEAGAPRARKEPCEECGGAGDSFQMVGVGEASFQRRYLALLAELPDAFIQPNGPDLAAKFTFDGGYGFLMPCRT